MVSRALLFLFLFHFGGGCVQEGIDEVARPAAVDEHYFRCRVQPIIAKSCAFMDCHGNDERPLRIYAEQRFRLDVDWLDFETPLTAAELSANLKVVGGFVSTEAGGVALLSEKPLDTRFGGLFHRGRDLYGQDDVYLSSDDADYQTLRAFASGASEASDCVPGSEP